MARESNTFFDRGILGKKQVVIFTKIRKKPLNSYTDAEHKKAHVSRQVMKMSPPNRSRP